VTRIESFIRRDSQKVFTSATLNRQMAALAGKLLRLPLEITVGGKSVVNSDVDQRVEVLQSSEAKFTRLLELLGNLYERDENADVRVLIFVERQETCDTLMVSLLRKGYPCSTLHGGKDQVDRDSTIGDFKAGVIPVLIATSVAARGLDVKELRLVVSLRSFFFTKHNFNVLDKSSAFPNYRQEIY
jgi:ATP-dependent RNA helicase DDX46/PRP5